MQAWQALILGIIEGITEYLPISSTGHLLVAQQLMGIGSGGQAAKAAADAFAICIQGGAILAVLGLYRERVLGVLRGMLGRDGDGLRLGMALIAGFLPAAVFGLIFDDWIEAKLFGLWPVIFAWVLGGLLILAAVWWRKKNPAKSGGRDLRELTWKLALIIGLLQCVAMWPGTSRSLMTIVGGLMVGLSVVAAVEFSFLLGVLTLTAATAKKAVWPVEGIDPAFDVWFGGAKLMWHTYGAMPILVGVVAATISAALAVKWLVNYLQSHGLSLFAWYRIAIGLALAGLVALGWISA